MNRKERKRERFQSIYRAMEPLRTAKTNTIRSLASVGRKHKWLRYPILISLVAFVFVYNLFLYAFIRMKVQEKLARALATAMTVVLVVTSIDLTALAMNTKEEGFYKLSSVDEIEDSLVSVLMGTPIEELELPETVSAYLDFYTLEEVVTDEEVEDPELEDPEVEDPDVENPEVEDPTVPNPEEPDLTVPNPEEPDPTVPNPEEPDPTVPNPEEPDPTVPNPEEPDPTVPNPEEPDPTVPNPEEPDPTVPNPEEPDPTVQDPVVTDPVVTDPVVEDPIVETPAPAPASEDVVVETQTVELEPVNSELQTDVTIETLSLDAEVIAEESTVSGNDNETENSGTGVVTGEIILQEKYVNTIPAELPVTWLCEDYDGDTAGDYIFTAKLSENTYNDYIYFVEEDIELPSITVRVAEPHTFESIVEVDGIEIQMTAAAGVFPEGAVLSVNKITDEASMQKITESVQDAVDEEAKEIDDTGKVQTTIAFDIKVLDENGEEIQPNIPEGMNPETAVQVTFKQIVPQMALPEDEVSGDQIMEVYYVEDSMESATVMETAVEDDSLSFSPEHFSTYVCTCWKTSWKSISSWEALYKAVYNKTGAINARLKKNIYVDSMFLKWDSYCLYLDEGQTLNLDLYGNDLWSEDDHSCIVDLSYGSTLNLHNTKGNGWIRGDDYSYAVLVRKNSTFNMYGGSIYKSGGASEGIRVYDGGKVNIYGGRIYGFNYGIYAPYSDTVTINMNGEGYIDNCKYGIYLAGNNKTVDIKSGDITNSTYAGIYNSYANSSVSFTGGKITGKSGYRTYGIYNPSGGSLTIGGNVNFSNNSYGDIYIRGVQEASYTSGTTNLVKISPALTGSKVGIRTYYTPTEAAPVVVASNNTSKDKLYNSTNSSYGVYQPTGKTYLVTGPMSNSNVTVTIEKEGLYTPDEIGGKVAGKIAWGTEALSTEDISKVVKFNAEVSLTAMIEDVDNYDFAGWYIGYNTTPASTELNYTFEAVGNVDVKAVFKKKTFKVTASALSSMGTASITSYKLPEDTQTRQIPSDGYFEVGSELVLSITANQRDTVTIDKVDLPEGAGTDITGNYPYTRYYEFVQWNDGFTDMTWTSIKDNPGTSPDYKITGTRTVTVTKDIDYVAQYKLPAPDRYATGIIFIGVKKITNGASADNGSLIPNNSNIIMIGIDDPANYKEPEMGDGNSDLLAVAGLPENHALAKVNTSHPTSSNYGTTMAHYDKYPCYDFSQKHDGKDAATLGNTGGYIFSVDPEVYEGVIAGPKFDTCKQGKVHYSPTCGYWHFWCSGGNVKGGGPYLLYTYTTSRSFKASNVSATLKELTYNDTPNAQTGKKEVKSITMDVTFTFPKEGANGADLVYTLANITWVDDDVCFSDGDRVVQLDLNGVLFTKILPEAMINGVEYATLAEALNAAQEGDTIYVQGDALTAFAGDITVPNNVTIKSFDGSTLAVTNGSTVNAETDGTIVLIGGTITATPPEGQDVTVDVNTNGKNASVSADKPVIVTTQGGGKVTTTENMTDIVISPDGDPNHTVTYVGKEGGIPSGTEYGLSSGELTVEEKVVISEGTEYDLKVDLGGTDQVIKTESTNTGDTTISKGQDTNGNNTVVIESQKKNNSVTVGEGQNAQEFITSEDGTKLVLTQGNENVGLEEGSVSVPKGGQIQLPSGQVIENSSNGTSDRITVSADDEGNENVNIPSGSKATINGIDVSVPSAGEGEAENLPAKVTVNQNGNVEVSGKPGNQVTIGGQNYTIGDYDATIEVAPDNDGDGKPETMVTEGSIVLAPGQSITDSNGVTYTNPAGSSGNMQLTMTPGQNTSVEVAPGESFTYKTENGTAGSYTNPSTSSDVSFSVSSGGNVSLDSEVSLTGPNNLSIETESGKVNVIVPGDNRGEVVIDPVSSSVTINKSGDKVSLGTTQYEATQDGTVLVPNGDRVELTDGGVKLDRNEEVYANGVGITNSGSGQLGVKLGDDGKTTVTVPQGGGFTMSDDESDNTVSFTNPGGQADYTINERGELEVGAGNSLTFNQGGVSTTISPGTGGATVTPTEDGVQLSVPAGGNITIGDVTYTNNGTDEMIIVVDPTGKPVIKGGSASIPTGESIYLQDGTKVSNKGGGVTIDANGKATVADGSNVGFTTNGKESNYIAAGGPVELTINPETGIPVKTGGSGKTQLGAGSSLEVITDTKTGASTGEEGANETELDQEQKLTITNNGTDTSAAPTVDDAGNVTVPENGKVTIKAESVKSDGSITTTENTISVPSGSEAVTLDPQTDGSVDVLFGDNAGKNSVIFNGKELTTDTPGTKLTVTETGASLEEGSIELDPDETISVNGTGFSNTGNADSKVNITKDTSTSPATTGVEVSPGGKFEMFVPGQKDTAVEFTNPDTANSADYSVDSEGNIKLENGEKISFDFPGGAQGVTVSGAPGAEGEDSYDVSLKVTEDGVKITAQPDNDIKINDTVFENTDTTEELVITIEPDGTPKLEEGSTVLPAGNSMKLPGGENITITGGNASVDSNGNITIPSGNTEDITLTIKTPDGKTHKYIVPAGSTEDVRLNCDPDSNTNVPVLENGTTQLGGGSKVATNNGKTTIQATDGNQVTVDKDGNFELQPGSGVKVDSDITDNGETIDALYQITTPVSNTGKVTAAPDNNGGYDIAVENRNDTVKVTGVVGGDTFTTEFTTTEDNTKLSVSDDGTTLEQGGVILDGGARPNESININGTGITNIGNSAISVNKDTSSGTPVTNLNVGAGGSFELFDPKAPDSAVKFTNPGATPADYTINADGSIELDNGSDISFVTSKNLPITLEGSNNVGVNVTEDGVEVTVPSGETVTINGKTYKSTGNEPLKMVIDNNGNKVITSGTTTVPSGESVYVKDTNGNLTEIKKDAATSSQNDDITVSANGNVGAKAGDEIIIGDGKYSSKDSTGEFDLKLNPATGEVTLTDGNNLGITDGNITIDDDTNGDVSVSTTGNKEVLIEKAEGAVKPTITIPAGGNATIDDGNNGSGVEILVPGTTAGGKEITMDGNGDLTVELAPGEQITIAGVIYTADENHNGNTTLTIDGATGSLKSSTGGNVETEIDPDGFNRPNYSYDVPSGGTVIIDGVEYEAPSGGMTIIGNPDGKPIIKVNQAGQSVTIGGKEYTAGSDNTKFIVNSEGNVTLVGDGSSIIVNSGDAMYVDGNKIVASGSGSATITKESDGSNSLTTNGNVQTEVTLGNNTPLNLAGTTATVNGSTYRAPSDGMTLTPNGAGKKPTVTVNKADTTVQIDGVGYTAGNDKTQFIVNSPNNVTLVDNNNNNANSSLVVKNPREMVIDGNTIKATGATTGGYTITKNETGNDISIKNGTKLDIAMGNAGSPIKVAENVIYEDRPTPGTSTTITPSKAGTQIVLDKTSTDGDGNYVTELKPAGTTTITPKVDEDGNITGFETTRPDPKPVTPPSSGGNSSSGSSSGTVNKPVEEVPEEEIEEELEESDEEAEDEALEEDDENTSEDSENDTSEDADGTTGDSSEPSSNGIIAGDGDTAGDAEEEDIYREPQNITIESLEEAVDVEITGNTQVTYGDGSIVIKAEGKGNIVSDLDTVLKACLNDKEIKKVNKGENVEIRFSAKVVKLEVITEDEKAQIVEAYQQFAEVISGFEIADTYDIVIERRMGDSDWEEIHELNTEIELVVDIPEEIRKDGRTYYLMRNHEGVCTLLEDIDTDAYTITVLTGHFSTYVISYTDAEVSDVDIEALNQSVMLSTSQGNNALLWILVIILAMAAAFGVWYYGKKRKEQ